MNGKLYYIFRKLIPRFLQIFIRSIITRKKIKLYKGIWPICPILTVKPNSFTGWPDGKKFALLFRHDVETEEGYCKCNELINIDKKYGFVSSFNFVPLRYTIKKEYLQYLIQNGFEVGVHGLKHDGKLYFNRRIFQKRAVLINGYLKEWGSVGFYSPSAHHNLGWLHELDILYDSSTFDSDPFEPQPEGVATIFPFLIKNKQNIKGYIEIPYTLPQDFTLFILLKEKDIRIWKEKLDFIVANNGVAFLNVHPDYMKFDNGKNKIFEYSACMYTDFLDYIKNTYNNQYYQPLPKELAAFWARSLSSGGNTE